MSEYPLTPSFVQSKLEENSKALIQVINYYLETGDYAFGKTWFFKKRKIQFRINQEKRFSFEGDKCKPSDYQNQATFLRILQQADLDFVKQQFRVQGWKLKVSESWGELPPSYYFKLVEVVASASNLAPLLESKNPYR